MILYRARTIASRPRRHPPFLGNSPEVRVRGRWFTDDLAAAIAHRETLDGPSEIIMVDVPDAVAESFRVQTTPVTICHIDARAHSRCPATDYILPMFRVMEAEPIAIAGEDRIRDYIDVTGRMPAQPRLVAPPEPMRLAA